MSQEVISNPSPMRLPMPALAEKSLGLDGARWKLLLDAFPAASDASVICKAYALLQFYKLDVQAFAGGVMHIIPFKDTKSKKTTDQIILGIKFKRIMAMRDGCAGIDEYEYADTHTVISGREIPDWATCTVWRIVGGVRCPFRAKVYASEFVKHGQYGLIGQWKERPMHMLGVRAESAALSKAFPELSVEAEVPINVSTYTNDLGDHVAVPRMLDDIVESSPPQHREPHPPPAQDSRTLNPVKDEKENNDAGQEPNEEAEAEAEAAPATDEAKPETKAKGRSKAKLIPKKEEPEEEPDDLPFGKGFS